jgi:hypothetical protein
LVVLLQAIGQPELYSYETGNNQHFWFLDRNQVCKNGL